jgi:signal transduction histidine kinase
LPTNQKIPFLTPTVKKFTAWNVFLFLIILLMINILLISIIKYMLHSTIDKRLQHEIEKVLATIEVQDSVINILDFSELNEPSFNIIGPNSFFLQIYDLDGNLLIGSNNLKRFDFIPLNHNIPSGDLFYEDMDIGDDRLRINYLPLNNDKGENVAFLQLSTFETEHKYILDRIIIFNIYVFPVIILIVIAASIFLAKKSFKPITKIVETAEQISAKSLTSRIEYGAKPDDEMGRLRDTLNGLFDRIESYVNQLSQFTDHASHQLMNPLTALKTELEFILKKDRTTDEYKQSLKQLLIQSDHMIKIVRTLLLLSKQHNEPDVHKSIFNLSKLIRFNVPEKLDSHIIKINVENNVYIKGDSEKFLMVLENLIDNAVKYSPNSKSIKIFLQTKDDYVELIIEDEGIGIEDSEKEKIFERFYRSENTEDIGIKGYGLGLSLVRTILLEIGAKIRIEDNHPTGSRFIISIKALNII